MSKCTGCLSCKWLRPSPWKKMLKSLYPPNTTGYERDLQAQCPENLAKHAARNDKLITPISDALLKNINRDLRKRKYGYVSIGVSAFVSLVDVCRDKLFKFEGSVFKIDTLLQTDDIDIHVDAMNLLIHVCQNKDRKEDPSNTQYLKFLDYILADCIIQLSDFEDTIRVYQICIDTLTQLVSICPDASITTHIPKIIPVLVDLIYFCFMTKNKTDKIVQLNSKLLHCLTDISTRNDTSLSNILFTSLIHSLDSYGWYPMNFVVATLKPLVSTKNREPYKTLYISILSHLQELLHLRVDNSEKGNESNQASEDEIEMTDFTITNKCLRIVCNILLYVQTIYKELRFIDNFNIKRIWIILLSIYSYFLELAMKNQISFPLDHQACVVEDVRQYEDNQTNTEMYHQCILQVNSVCEDTIVTFGKSISDMSLFFMLIYYVLKELEIEEEVFVKQFLRLIIQIVAAKTTPSSILPQKELIWKLSSNIHTQDSEIRLLWIQLLSTLFHMIKANNSSCAIISLCDLPLQSALYQSFLMENNTKEHYQELSSILTQILTLDIQNGLLFVLPILLASQTKVVENVGGFTAMPLLQYLDSTTISNTILSQQDNMNTMSQIMNSRSLMSELEPVIEGEEEEEETTHEDELNHDEVEKGNEIHLTEIESIATREEDINIVSSPINLEEIPIHIDEEKSPFDVSQPSSLQYEILSCNLTLLLTIATLLKSEELQQYITTIQVYQHDHWNEDNSHDQRWAGKQAFYQKEAIVQFIIRSPVILASPVPTDYADKLRLPLPIDVVIDEEELLHGNLHRLNSISSSSELSIKNSVRDSDSDAVEFNYQHENASFEMLQGSRYIMENPQCSFAELIENAKLAREEKNLKLIEKIENTSSTRNITMNSKTPGFDNRTVSLMI